MPQCNYWLRRLHPILLGESGSGNTYRLTFQRSPVSLFRQGLFCGSTNPKSILFFAVLQPQFIDPHRSLAI